MSSSDHHNMLFDVHLFMEHILYCNSICAHFTFQIKPTALALLTSLLHQKHKSNKGILF